MASGTVRNYADNRVRDDDYGVVRASGACNMRDLTCLTYSRLSRMRCGFAGGIFGGLLIGDVPVIFLLFDATRTRGKRSPGSVRGTGRGYSYV